MPDRTFSFEVNRTSSAPPEVLFRMETHGPLWARWGRPVVWQASWEREGDPAPAGVGAIRRIGLWPLLVREETVEYEPNRRHVYTLIGPGPASTMRYHAEVLFTPNAAGGTDLRWHGSFTEASPGTGPPVRAILRATISFFATRLTRAAERDA